MQMTTKEDLENWITENADPEAETPLPHLIAEAGKAALASGDKAAIRRVIDAADEFDWMERSRMNTKGKE